MSLGRAWTRQLLTASAAALLAPGAVIAALLVLSFSGGFGSLNALGQVLGGPTLPPSPLTQGAPGGQARGGRVLSARRPGAASHGGRVATVHGRASSSLRSSKRVFAQHRSTSAQPGVGGPGGQRGGASYQPSPSHGPAPSPGPGPTPKPTHRATVVDRVLAGGTGVTSHIPGPAGQAATGALHSAGSALDGVLPHGL